MTDENITTLNKNHLVAQDGGKTRVYNEGFDRVLNRDVITNSSFDDFRNLYLNKYAEIEKPNAKGKIETKFVSIGDFWLRNIDRRQYDEIVFAPGSEEQVGIYNLWRGFKIKPKENGSWELLQKHILDNVCSGNEEYYNYYLDWWSNAIQFPDQQANVAIVLKGKRGGGKGTAIGYFAELFGQHHIHVFSTRQVTGNFNYHMRDAVVLYSDEAVYAGNKAEESVLKGLITEKFIPIEGKHRDLIMVKNNLHVVMSTNNEWAVPAGLDERRFFVLNMKDDEEVKQNTAYFNAIKLQMMNGGNEKLLFDMQQRDISQFNTYKAPNTVGLLEQKIQSLDSLQAWWYEKLSSGYIFDGIDWQKEMPAESVYIDYINRCKDHGSKYRENSTHFGRFLSEMMPKEAGCKIAKGEIVCWPEISRRQPEKFFEENKLLLSVGPTKKHYRFPELDACRANFDKIAGHKINWPVLLSSKMTGTSSLEAI